jgi:hypothetical protein
LLHFLIVCGLPNELTPRDHGHARSLQEALVLSESRNGVCAVMFLIWPPVGFAPDNIGLTDDRKGQM